MQLIRRAMIFAVASVCAGGAAATGVLAIAEESDAPGLAPSSPATGVVRAVQGDQAASFAIFARARKTADEIPESLNGLIGDSPVSGRNSSLSRAIETPHGKGWAVPGDSHVCLAVPDPVGFGITCDPTAKAARDGAVNFMVSEDNVVLATLLLPKDGTASVEQRDGSRLPLHPTADGIASALVTGASSVIVTTAGGSTRHAIPSASKPDLQALR